MAKNNLNKTQDIYVKVDQNNLLYVDPNSVISDGEVLMRNIEQENLVIYVNLEADLVPRTNLIVDKEKNTTTLTIAEGTLNFLKKQGGGDYDSTWTDSFIETNQIVNTDESSLYKSDASAQSFGIESININVKGGNFIPQININFIDVRGKTLFESPENSPYKAFFHLPWPIFYLTVKGHYGKAIRYRLHLTKFTSRFNGNSGNFEINTTFVGSTYAYLADIPINGILNAPYMYSSEKTSTGRFNPNTGRYEKTISKSSKGFTTLKSVYEEYVRKGYLPNSFLEKPRTLREIITIAKSLDRILEREIFDQSVDMRIFSGIKEFEKTISEFKKYVNEWGQRNLSSTTFTKNNISYRYLAASKGNNLELVENPKKNGTLEQLLVNGVTLLKKNKLYTEDLKKKTGGADFKKLAISVNNSIKSINQYYEDTNGKYGVAIDKILDDIDIISNSLNVQKQKVQDSVEKKMNDIFLDKEKGLGFIPTIKNIFAIICANADTYIRLLKDVHIKSFDSGVERALRIGKLGDEAPGDQIFPWPQVKRLGKNKQKVLAYPGHKDLVKVLNSNNPVLWPEIEFLENFYGVATKRIDSLSDKEGGVQNISFVFQNDEEYVDTPKQSTLFSLMNFQPYLNKSIASILYEIYERARYITYFDSFGSTLLNNQTDAINELAQNEFEIISNLLKEDTDLLDILKTISTPDLLVNKMISVSPYERYPYFRDELPTVDYIKTLVNKPYKIEEYFNAPKNPDRDDKFQKLRNNLKNYKLEPYRLNIYPFNSTKYLSYIDKTSYDSSNFNLGDILDIKTEDGLISSNILKMKDYVKPGFEDNLFFHKLYIGSGVTREYILNTPYFHNQLYTDFQKSKSFGKYAGSAYLFLNSLPFKELSDYVTGTTRMSSMFKEVSASHVIPYHLICKWGSIYHRYKTYLYDGYDILTGMTTSNEDTTTKSLDVSQYYDVSGNTSQIFLAYDKKSTFSRPVTLSDNTDVGLYPYYQTVFHRILTGEDLFDPNDQITYNTNSSSGKINLRARNFGGKNYWTGFVNESGYTSTNINYTILPSDGANIDINFQSPSHNDSLQSNFRIIWDDVVLDRTYEGIKFPNYGEYNVSYETGRTRDNQYRIENEYQKIYDLIAVFSPNILNDFENIFLDFATDKVGELEPFKKFTLSLQDNFITILKNVVTVKHTDSDPSDINLLINKIKSTQSENLREITKDILNPVNGIKLTMGNPKEIDTYIWVGFTNVDNESSFQTGRYFESQYVDNQNLLKLYVGEEPVTDVYKDFFKFNNIELSEENILNFRPLVHIWGGYLKAGGTKTNEAFKKYIQDNFFVSSGTLTNQSAVTRKSYYLTTLLSKFPSLQGPSQRQTITLDQGYNEEPIKLELYNFFKSFNDKWIAGNSIGQKLLIEEFLFLDKRNIDIGNSAFLSMDKLVSLEDPKNDKQSMYGVISMLIAGTGFDMRALPAYVNFYGLSGSSSKVIPSKKVANNLFGTFLEVDYEESSPKIILQYVGHTSKHLDLKDINKNGFLFNNDTFNMADSTHPLIITSPIEFQNSDFKNSNRVVAFDVNIGDQNQSIFKGVSLSQDSIKNTTESFIVMEQLGRSEAGSATSQIDVSLFDIYRQASYTCEVTCMGNAMIQPTMFFYLKNVPMFRGSYWITQVTHSIRNNNMETTFTGVRMSRNALPDPQDSFTASFRALFERITDKAIARQKEEDLRLGGKTQNETTISTETGNYTIDMGSKDKEIAGEQIINLSQINEFGIRYNGFNGEKYIQLVSNSNGPIDKRYLRAVATIMGGKTYGLELNTVMTIPNITKEININSGDSTRESKILWSDIVNSKNYFYAVNYDLGNMVFVPQGDKILKAKTTFYNPKDLKTTVTIDGYTNSDTVTPQNIKGGIHKGPNVNGYGIALSKELAKKLNINDGDVVYFTVE